LVHRTGRGLPQDGREQVFSRPRPLRPGPKPHVSARPHGHWPCLGPPMTRDRALAVVHSIGPPTDRDAARVPAQETTARRGSPRHPSAAQTDAHKVNTTSPPRCTTGAGMVAAAICWRPTGRSRSPALITPANHGRDRPRPTEDQSRVPGAKASQSARRQPGSLTADPRMTRPERGAGSEAAKGGGGAGVPSPSSGDRAPKWHVDRL